jgi:hypothetical protein
MALAAGAGVVLLLLAGLYALTRQSQTAAPPQEQHLPFGDAEKAYAERLKFSEQKMGRAGNFLGQEVTFLFGTLSNNGPRAVRDVEVLIEFRDQFNQVVLRETRRLLGRRAPPLPAGQNREYQIAFEHVPVDWNVQYPGMRIVGLLFE